MRGTAKRPPDRPRRAKKSAQALLDVLASDGSVPPAPPPIEDARAPLSLDLQRIRSALNKMLEGPLTVRAAQAQLEQATLLADGHGGDPTVRFLLLQLKELAGQRGLAEEWSALLRQEPEDVAVIRFTARSLVKDRRSSEALELIDRLIPENLGNASSSLTRAELLSDIQAHDVSDTLFREQITLHDRREARISFAKRLRKRGLVAAGSRI